MPKFNYHPKYPNQVILRQTPNWILSLWDNQYYLGRATIENKDISIRHLHELPPNHLEELIDLIKNYELALMKAFNTTHFNWTCLMNDSYKPKNRENPDEFHLHVHPRYEKPITFAGHTFIDEVFGHHYDKKKEDKVSLDVYKKIAIEIQKYLN